MSGRLSGRNRPPSGASPMATASLKETGSVWPRVEIYRMTEDRCQRTEDRGSFFRAIGSVAVLGGPFTVPWLAIQAKRRVCDAHGLVGLGAVDGDGDLDL